MNTDRGKIRILAANSRANGNPEWVSNSRFREFDAALRIRRFFFCLIVCCGMGKIGGLPVNHRRYHRLPVGGMVAEPDRLVAP